MTDENQLKPDTSILAPDFETTTESFEPTELDIQTSDVSKIEDEVEKTEKRLAESGVLTADLINEVKKLVTAEIVAELKEDKVLAAKEKEIEREQEDLEYNRYVARMQASDDPWVDFVGNVRDTEMGQRLQMEWNDAFIVYLRECGITGADDEQVVQKYISLLLKDMVDKNEERYGKDFE